MVTYVSSAGADSARSYSGFDFAGFLLFVYVDPRGVFRDSDGDRHILKNVKERVVGLPLGLPVVVLCAYPTIAFVRGPVRRYRRHRRRKRGLCVTCGYNLTGNVSGVCPECGREI